VGAAPLLGRRLAARGLGQPWAVELLCVHLHCHMLKDKFITFIAVIEHVPMEVGT
jgi:hypothetical protein